MCHFYVLHLHCKFAMQKKTSKKLFEVLTGGQYRTRTCDLPHVKGMLSQLS